MYYGNPNITVTAINTSGAALDLSTVLYTGSGSGGATGVYDNVALTGGTGTGATARITINSPYNSSGAVIDCQIKNPGTGYVAGDVLSAASGDIGGCTGFSVPVASIGIAASRLSGQTPAFVQVSASPISCTGTVPGGLELVPYDDLHYEWDFGEPSGTETFVRPTDGVTVNANRQTGPEAAYVYRTAGSKTITLTVYAKNGDAYTTASRTLTFDVTDFTPTYEYYADSAATGTGTGLSPTDAWTTVSAINSGIAGKSNLRLNVARGSVFTGSAALNTGSGVTTTGFRMRAYGTGANPKFSVTDLNGLGAIALGNGSGGTGHPKADYVYSDIDAEIVSTISGGVAPFSLAGVSRWSARDGFLTNIYLDKCNSTVMVDDQLLFYGQSTTSANFNFGFWGCNFENSPGTVVGGTFAGGYYWQFFLGCSFAGDGPDANRDHHIYPECNRHSLYKWNYFPAAAGKNYCVNTCWYSFTGASEFAEFHLFSENYYGAGLYAFDAAPGAYSSASFTSGSADISVNVARNGSPFPVVGQTIAFLRVAGLNNGFTPGQEYFVVSVSAPVGRVVTVQASATRGGTAIVSSATVTGASLAETIFTHLVDERSLYADSKGAYFDGGWGVTVRDSRGYRSTAPGLFTPGFSIAPVLKAKLYRNYQYTSSAVSAGAAVSLYNTTAGPGFNQPYQITDNTFVDARASANIFTVVESDQLAAGSIIDRNTYSTTDTTFQYNGATQRSFAQWQSATFDVNGTNLAGSTPAGWTSPPTQWQDFDDGKRRIKW